MESAVENVVGELAATRHEGYKDDLSLISVHKYLTNNNYRSLIAFSLIFMFSLVFYLIYLIMDAFIDKQKHYELCVKSYERYEKRCRAKAKLKQLKQQKELDQNTEKLTKENADIEGNEDDEKPDKVRELERQSKLEFTVWSHRNLQISFIHSVLSSLWIIRIAIARWEPLYADLLFYVSWDTYLLVAFSAGYFLYDFYDIYANGYAKKEWVVLLHHAIVLISFSFHMCALQSIGYTCLALCMEFNSVFLHARKLLSFYMFEKRSATYLFNLVCNILTFLFFRFGVLGVIYYGVCKDGHRVHWTYLVVLVTLVTIMAIINLFLFKRVIERDFIPLICSKKKNKSVMNSDNRNFTKTSKKNKKKKAGAGERIMDQPDENDKSLFVDNQNMLTSDNLPIINNAQSNVVLVMVE